MPRLLLVIKKRVLHRTCWEKWERNYLLVLLVINWLLNRFFLKLVPKSSARKYPLLKLESARVIFFIKTIAKNYA